MRRDYPPRAGLAAVWAVATLLPSGPVLKASTDSDLQKQVRQMITDARDSVFPALVNIHVVKVDYRGGKEHKGRAVGSGTIITADGHVLTNCHVTLRGRTFRCVLADRQEVEAVKVGEDPLTDLAVLKLSLSELADPKAALPVAAFGDSDAVEVGDYVMAMGSPLALARSVTLGIVSNTERILGSNDSLQLEVGQRTGLFNRWIQHDAAINPGNSGGPLVNLDGEVIGVNTRGGGVGGDMGFAIPSNVARAVAAALIEKGEVERSWYGVALKPIKDTGYEEGVLVNSVVEDSPAARAGIEPGDVIVRIDGEPTTVRFPEEVPPLVRRLADRPVGSSVAFTLHRHGETVEATVVSARLERDRGDEAALRAWGLTARGITEKTARDRRLDSTMGVLVTGVRSGGPAALSEPAISYGDVILALDGESVHDMSAFIAQYKRILARDPMPEYVMIEFDRQGKNQITLIEPKPDEDDEPPREVPKAWIGIATQPVVKNLAAQLGHPEQRGFRITRVYPKTLAAGTDLRVGDVILELNGEKVRPRGMQDAGLFARRVRKLDIDAEATLTVLRGGETLDVAVTLERTRISPSEARRDRNRDFDLSVREVTFFDRDENRWGENVNGVIVTQVEGAGWAGLGGILAGDLILRIDSHAIKDLEAYRSAMKAVTEAEPERVAFVVLRGATTSFQYVEPDWKPVSEEDSRSSHGDESEPD